MTSDDRVRRAVSALKHADNARHAPSDIDRLVLEAFDRSVRERDKAQNSTARWTARLLSLAAGLIVIISGLAYVREWHRQTPSKATNPAQVATAADRRASHDDFLPSAAPLPPPISAGGDHVRRHARAAARTMVHRRVAPRGLDMTQHVNEEFEDVVRVVRVRVPRATLPSLGIAVIDPGAAGTVDLEVLAGVDGLARTIRMVQ